MENFIFCAVLTFLAKTLLYNCLPVFTVLTGHKVLEISKVLKEAKSEH